jgi:4-amino-4-deoxy-L-arabinose transferase-like glycosyltransferase
MTFNKAVPHTDRSWWLLYVVAAASFLPALFFHYVGEEAIFPISALEMWYHNEPIRRLLLGVDLQHNPLFTWLIIPLSVLFGWDAMLVVTRAITLAATVGTGLVLAALAQFLYGNRLFSAVVAVVYLTLADLFFYRGWLAYVDPLFGLLVFASIAALWVACERRHAGWLMLALLALTGAFLAKALTAYVFYAGAGLVLLFRGHRRFLLSPSSLALHAGALVLPLVWLRVFAASSGQGTRMFSEILAKLAPESFADYLLKLITYPLETLWCLAPAGIIALWMLWRRDPVREHVPDPHMVTGLLILLVNFLPYWLAPQSHVRYLVPLYPLAGLVIARVLWTGGEKVLWNIRRWIIVLIGFKFLIMLIGFPLYQERYRGANYQETAQTIMKRTTGYPLYSMNVSASGLSVAAYIDTARLPQAPLAFPPAQWSDGFVIAYEPNPELGTLAEKFRLGGNELYLLCRGAACAAQPAEGLRK